MRILSLAFVVAFASSAFAQQPGKGSAAPAPKQPPKPEPPKAAAAPPEVKTTVDAFKGNWKFDATLALPGAEKPAAFKMTFNCKPAAGGTAAACEAKAKTPIGPFEGLFVAVYDPTSKAVHFFGITNQHE